MPLLLLPQQQQQQIPTLKTSTTTAVTAVTAAKTTASNSSSLDLNTETTETVEMSIDVTPNSIIVQKKHIFKEVRSCSYLVKIGYSHKSTFILYFIK